MACHMVLKKVFRLFFFLCLLSGTHSRAATYFFDMSGVLVTTDKKRAAQEIGLHNFLYYTLCLNNPKKADNALFDYLDKVKPRDPYTPASCHGEAPLPQLMCDWLTGAKTCAQLRREAKVRKPSLNPKHTIARAIAKFMFTPHKFARAIKINTPAYNFVHQLCQETDVQGNPKHRLCIVSNWDKESFALLKKDPEFWTLFAHFDHIFVSGEMGMIKPDPKLFPAIYEQLDIDPDQEECIFFDDQPENIQVFNQSGNKAHGILCPKDDILPAYKHKQKN